MRNRIGLLAILGILLLAVACAPVEQGQSKMSAEAAMDDLVHRWDEAMHAGDVDSAAELYVESDGAIMPPDMPAYTGRDGLKTVFSEMFSDGGIDITNQKERVISSGDLVIASGTYTLTPPGESVPEKGKWTAISRQRDDGSLVAVRNIWNRDAPAPGEATPPPIDATGPAPAEDAPCAASPRALDEAFAANYTEGKVAEMVAIHSEDAERMPPAMQPVVGQTEIANYLQSRIDQLSDRVLELVDIGEQIAEDVGYTWGDFRIAYKAADSDEPVAEQGKYVAVSRKDDDGCWRYEWVQWNGNQPPQEEPGG